MRTISTFTTHRVITKVRYDSEVSEYRVELHTDGVHNKAADYHTDDKADAMVTAESMMFSAYAALPDLG